VRLAGPFWRTYRRVRRGRVKGFREISAVMKNPDLSNAGIRGMRDELRCFLEEAAKSGASSRLNNLQRLREAVSQHPAVWDHNFAYHQLFDAAAECVPPWRA